MTSYDLKFSVPIAITVNQKGRKLILNMNTYRNAHFRILAKAKTEFNNQIFSLDLYDRAIHPFKNPVQMHYDYYPASKRSYDRMNILSIVDKFTCDALIIAGVLQDDNYKLVLTPTFNPCAPDKDNPRCDVFIKET